MTAVRDLTGLKFERWTVISQGPSKKGKARWLCRCQCGSEALVGSGNLLRGVSTQCIKCAGRVLIDLSGRRFGRWTVLEQGDNRVTHKTDGRWTVLWKCRCECGEIGLVSSGNLRHGSSTQCNKCARGYEDLTGKRFGKWEVLERIDKPSVPQIPLWRCRCECGNEGVLRSTNLTRGYSKQCGRCSRRENPAIRIRPYEALFNWLRRRALQEQHEVTITYEDFAKLAEATQCHYCEDDIYFAKHCVNRTGHKYNIDRKDNNLGYVSGNVVPCCKTCNHAKGSRYTYEQWWEMTAPLRRENRKKHKAIAAAVASQSSLF